MPAAMANTPRTAPASARFIPPAMSSGSRALGEDQRRVGQGRDASLHGGGVGAGGGAVADPADDALADAGQAEHVVGKVPVEVRQTVTVRRRAILLHGFLDGRDTPGLQI